MQRLGFFGELLARIPANEVVIPTTVPSYGVIERLEQALQPEIRIRRRSYYFTFHGGYRGSFFTIQSHLRKPDGSDAYPAEHTFVIRFFGLPFPVPYYIETSPVFYGRVFDDEQGAVIRGHFGFPLAYVGLLVALFLALARYAFPQSEAMLLVIALVASIVSLFLLPEYLQERKGIEDFLKGLFYNVRRSA